MSIIFITTSSATAARVGGRYPFKVIKVLDVSINRRPVCDNFLLVIITLLTSYHVPFASIGQLVAFDKGVPLVNALVFGNLSE